MGRLLFTPYTSEELQAADHPSSDAAWSSQKQTQILHCVQDDSALGGMIT
jgi:hypothetical protein